MFDPMLERNWHQPEPIQGLPMADLTMSGAEVANN
jgi:hypothetical protein